MIAKDFLSDPDGDLLIKDGDFVIGESEEQHINDILVSHPGGWRQTPFLGVGISKFFNSPLNSGVLTSARKRIKLMLEMDNYKDIVIAMKDLFSINIKANRKK